MAKKKKDYKYYIGKKYDGMMGRCYRETDNSFKNYGARGIRVCEVWVKSIQNFRTWFLSELEKNNITLEEFTKNSKNIQLDRINVDGHYSPENCKLVSPQNNSRNTRVRKKKLYETAEGTKVFV